MTKFLLMSGQSNMIGRGKGGLWSMPANLRIWDNSNERDDLELLGTQTIRPKRGAVPFHHYDNCLGIQIAGFYARQTVDQVRVFVSAKGQQPISAWHDGTTVGPQLKRILAIDPHTVCSAFCWHQGESGITVAGWSGMIDVLKTQGLITNSTPIVMGTVAPIFAEANDTIEEIAASDPNIRLARVGNLPKEPDGVHFTGDSCVTAGLVYAGLAVGAAI